MTTIHGRDAYGRPISLLNDHQQPQSWETWAAESISTSPDSMAPTPDLWRSSSCSSRQTVDDSSSPATPADGGEQDGHSPASVVVLPTALHASLGVHVHPPLLPKQMPEHPSMHHHLHQPQRSSVVIAGIKASSPTPTSPNPDHDPHQSSSMTTVSAKPMPKRYPCQFADTLDCREMFTTSGHASRHAKRHTGEKNVACPRCPKRFARKDNMKQHLKTHEGGTRSTGGGMPSSTPSMTEDLSSPASSVSPSPPPSRAAQMRPPLRRSSATNHVPRRASPSSSHVVAAASTTMGCASPIGGLLSPLVPPSSSYHPSSPSSSSAVVSSFPSPLFTPGLDALVIAADSLDHDRMIH